MNYCVYCKDIRHRAVKATYLVGPRRPTHEGEYVCGMHLPIAVRMNHGGPPDDRYARVTYLKDR